MGTPIIQGFSLKSISPIDERFIFKTKQDMASYKDIFLPDMYLCFNLEDRQLYVYSKQNTVDPDTGKWRKFEGGSGGSERYVHSQDTQSDKWNVQHGLNEQYPSNIMCIDDSGNEIYGDVEYYSNNLTIITFSEPLSGKCIVIK